MSKPSKGGKPANETWMDRYLKEKGIEIQEVEPPKDFVRVMIPKNNTQDK